jgi:hypothetical protein
MSADQKKVGREFRESTRIKRREKTRGRLARRVALQQEHVILLASPDTGAVWSEATKSKICAHLRKSAAKTAVSRQPALGLAQLFDVRRATAPRAAGCGPYRDKQLEW